MNAAENSLLLRHLGGDLARYEEAKRGIAARRAAELQQLRLSVARDCLSNRPRCEWSPAEPPRPAPLDQASATDALPFVRQMALSFIFLDALADALLRHEELFRPVVEYLAKKPRGKKPANSAGKTPPEISRFR